MSHHHHGHDHHGHHGHHHAPASFGRAFAIGIILNTVYVIVEAGFGLAIGSMGLLADAGHNASDVLSLIVAWVGASLALRPPSKRFTYGLRRSPILASLLNALLLFGAMGIVAWEAIQRFQSPSPISGQLIIWVTLVGLVVNFGTAYLFMRGGDDLNIRGAYLHMLADGLVTLGVLVAGVIMAYTQWYWVDPVISLIIVVVVLWGTWGLFRGALDMSMDAVPPNIDLATVREFLNSLSPVREVHDLHVWSMSTTEVALTAHLLLPDTEVDTQALLNKASTGLKEQFKIAHSTIQIELGQQPSDCSPCT